MMEHREKGLALLTDLYQLTMAYGYWKSGRSEQRAIFHLFFRRPPFQGGYAIAAGLQPALDYLTNLRFETSDIEYLASLVGNDGESLFELEFLDYLASLKFNCDVSAVPEGTLVFGSEPLMRVDGPILQCQIVETALLNMINFQTLIATKAARVCLAAGDDDVLEFGLRRAQGVDGGLSASRAAYIGGCAATSNVLAGKEFGIPVRGTHAHSWVMSFDSEREAFKTYANVMPNNCVFLVDTYDTLNGVRLAVEFGKQLRAAGKEMIGIRLDSGDLAYLSMEARKILDEGGFPNAKIVASNDLNEIVIESLKNQGATISVWGVGTQLATAFDQPALGGVYKLGALMNSENEWVPKIKLSEQIAKTTIPGKLQVRRFFNTRGFEADMIFDEHDAPSKIENRIIDARDPTRDRPLSADSQHIDLLQSVIRGGELTAEHEPVEVIRSRAKTELGKLHSGIKRFLNPHEYPVGLEVGLGRRRNDMIAAARETNSQSE